MSESRATPKPQGRAAQGNFEFKVGPMAPNAHTKDVPDTEFNRKYPPDVWGEEFSENARLWKVYRDERTAADRSMLDGWHKTLDVLLIFAALFSAVSTAFLIESYKNLQPDYAQYMATFMYAAAVAYNTTGSPLPRLDHILPPDSVTLTTNARWVNGLWFSSLVASLAVALLCILVKQWLDEYFAHIVESARSLRYWAQRHVLYRNGLLSWGVPALISGLPLLLHLSLFLFFVGLVMFLRPLDSAIAYAVLGMTLFAVCFYGASTFLPAWHIECPSYTPLLPQMQRAWFHCISILARLLDILSRMMLRLAQLHFTRKHPRQGMIAQPTPKAHRGFFAAHSFLRRASWTISQPQPRPVRESRILANQSKMLDGVALMQFLQSTYDRDVITVGLEAIGSITSTTTLNMLPHLNKFAADGSLFGLGLNSSWDANTSSRLSFARYARSWLSARNFPEERHSSFYKPLLSIEPSPDLGNEGVLLSILVQFYQSDFNPAALETMLQFFTALHEPVIRSITELSVDESSPEPTVLVPTSCYSALFAVDRSNTFMPELVIHLFHAGRLFNAEDDTLVEFSRRLGKRLVQRNIGRRWKFHDVALRPLRSDGRAQCFNHLCCMLNHRTVLSIDTKSAALLLHDLGHFAGALLPSDGQRYPWLAIPDKHMEAEPQRLTKPLHLQSAGLRNTVNPRLFDIPEFVNLICSDEFPQPALSCDWGTLKSFVDLLEFVKYGDDTSVSLSRLGTCYGVLFNAMLVYTGTQRSLLDVGRRLNDSVSGFSFERVGEVAQEDIFVSLATGPSSVATWPSLDPADADRDGVRQFGNFCEHVALLSKILVRRNTKQRVEHADIAAFVGSRYVRDVLRYTLRGIWSQPRSLTVRHVRDIAKHCIRLSPSVWIQLCDALQNEDEYMAVEGETGLKEYVVHALELLSSEFMLNGQSRTACGDECACMTVDRQPHLMLWHRHPPAAMVP
ncbi:hypothetical protein AURDEDRAFT_162412 [Auricularia subglabra TFB-10046 SS5]|nr:hypothetical protein AURDEDRAFT_162412 [Auricularia subglabra TFB-10046 SS5]